MKILLYLLVVLSILNGCNRKQISNKIVPLDKSISIVAKEEERFEDFYAKFYSDSIFQISRIVFPLPGADSDVVYGDAIVEDKETETFMVQNNKLFWKRSGWKFLKTLNQKSEMFVKTIEKDSSIIREQIRSKETDLVITCEFSLIEKKWMLTYFASEWY